METTSIVAQTPAARNGRRTHSVVPISSRRHRIASVGRVRAGRAELDGGLSGVVAGGDYYYVSNSHWPRFGEDGSLKPGPPLTAPTVLKLGSNDLGHN